MQRLCQGTRWVLRFADGEDLIATLADFARSEGIRAGFVVSAIGGIGRATLGYWTGTEYAARPLAGFHELVGLAGSVAVADGKPSVHLHASLGEASHGVVGGHLLDARVQNLVELYLETFPGHTFGRPMDESLGLRVLDLAPGPNL